jgi:hypothetical protein
MPKISTYSTVVPVDSDLVLITDASDSNNTRNVTVGALRSSGIPTTFAYTEIYDSTSGGVTTISVTNTFYPLAVTAIQGANNDATLTSTAAGVITNTGASRTFLVSYWASASSGNNNNLMFRIAKNTVTIAYSESDTITVNNAKASTCSNSVILTLAQNDTVQLYCANATATQSITLEHFNFIVRQV